jgi:hypothetical protein
MVDFKKADLSSEPEELSGNKRATIRYPVVVSSWNMLGPPKEDEHYDFYLKQEATDGDPAWRIDVILKRI